MDTIVLKFGGSSVSDNIKLNIVSAFGIFSITIFSAETLASRSINFLTGQKKRILLFFFENCKKSGIISVLYYTGFTKGAVGCIR